MEGLGIAGTSRAARPVLSRLRSAGLSCESYAIFPAASGADAARFAEGLRVLLLMPRDIAEAEALLFEAEAFAKRAPALSMIVLATTLSPRYIRALRGRIAPEIALIDAPFSGTLRAVELGALSFFLGGRREDLARIQPVFDILGRQSIRMGGFGSAMAAKVLNDFLAASSTAMTRIALDWAEAQGIDEARLMEVTEASLGRSQAGAGQELLEYTTLTGDADETVSALVKDVETALDAALAGAHLTPPRALEQLFRTMKSRALH